MRYEKPNCKHEWPEALRYRFFEKMGYEFWVKACKAGHPVRFSDIKNKTGNVDLDFQGLEKEKKDRFYDAYDRGVIELPIVVKFGHSKYDLLGGNTRLAGLIMNGKDPYVWLIDVTKSDDDENALSLNEDKLKGGDSDSKTLEDIAKKHDKKGYYHIDNMVASLKKQVKIGLPLELEHTKDEKVALEIVKDHLWEDPSYYTKLKKAGLNEKNNPYNPEDDSDDVFPKGTSDWRKKKESNELWVRDEDPIDNDLEDPDDDDDDKKPKPKPKKDVKETDSSSSGAYAAPFGGKAAVIKRPISKIPNYVNEAADSSISAGAAFDVPFGGGGTKGRRDPLKIDGPKSIYKNRAVKDKKFPRFGGPDAVFVKIKEKCKKFPYCNQGDQGNLEFLHEDQEFKDAISKAAEMYGIPYSDVEKIVINEIKKIFI